MAGHKLRDYQKLGIELVFDAWKQGARSVLMVLPAGGGKTSIFTTIVSDLAEKKLPSLINVHRRELATQAAARLREFETPFGFIMAGEPRRPHSYVQIASVQTLVRRKAPPAVLVVNDEAHLSTSKDTWGKVLAQYPNAKILGVTATPWRLSGKPLAAQYDAVVVVSTPRDLCKAGYLSPYVGFSYRTPDLEAVKTVKGEYDQRQSADAMGTVVDTVVEEWLKHSSTLSTVVFAVTVEHSKTLTQKFKDAGVTAEHIDGTMSLDQRKQILKRVEDGRTQVLCNVGIAVEGLDIPRLKCCVLARPTKSLARAIQMMGRVRRPWNGVTARIHDHAFVIRQHGLPDDDRDYRLDAAKEEQTTNVDSITTCPKCLALYRGSHCTACAEPRPVGERVVNTITDAEKVEFDSSQTTAQVERQPVAVKWNSEGREIEGVLVKRWDEPTNYGKQRLYRIKAEKRDYDLPGTVVLNARMASIPSGTTVRITYLGETPVGEGRARKEFKVEQWKDSSSEMVRT